MSNSRYLHKKRTIYESSLNFNDNSSQWVDWSNPSKLQITGAITIECVVKKTTGYVSGDSPRVICAKGDDLLGDLSYAITFDGSASPTGSNDSIQAVISADGSTPISITGQSFPIEINREYHIALVYVPSISLSLYINGNLRAIRTSGIPASLYNSGGGANFKFGRRDGVGLVPSNPLYTPMDLTVVRVYNRDLFPIEILYNAKRGVVSEFTKQDIVFESPSKRKTFKDTGNIYGFGANSIIYFDTSQQYNLDKVSPIPASHGVMNGWTDDDVVNPYPKSVKPFYKTHPFLIPTAGDFTRSSNQKVKIANFPKIVDQSRTFYAKFIIKELGGYQGGNQLTLLDSELETPGTSANDEEGVLFTLLTSADLALFRHTDEGGGDWAEIRYDYQFKVGVVYDLAYSWQLTDIQNDMSNTVLVINGVEITSFTSKQERPGFSIAKTDSDLKIGYRTDFWSNPTYGNELSFFGYIHNIAIADYKKNATELITDTNNGFLSNGTGVKLFDIPFYEVLEDVTGSYTPVIDNPVNPDDGIIGGGLCVEVEQKGKIGSFKPEPKQGLHIQIPGGVQGTDVVKGISMDNTNLPNNNEDYSFHVSFKSTFLSTIIGSKFNYQLIFSIGNTITNTPSREGVFLFYSPTNGSGLLDRLILQHITSSGNSPIVIQPFKSLADNSIISIGARFNQIDLVNELFINGIKVAEVATAAPIDFTSLAGGAVMGLGLYGIDIDNISDPTGNDEKYFNVLFAKKLLKSKEFADLHNQSLLSSPYRALPNNVGQEDVTVYHNFNEGEVSNTQTLKNYGSGADSNIIGFVDQTDIRNNISDLDTER